MKFNRNMMIALVTMLACVACGLKKDLVRPEKESEFRVQNSVKEAQQEQLP